MTNSAVKRMISKFEAMGCLDDKPYSGRLSTSAITAQTVQEKMEIITGSSTHEEVELAFNTLLFE